MVLWSNTPARSACTRSSPTSKTALPCRLPVTDWFGMSGPLSVACTPSGFTVTCASFKVSAPSRPSTGPVSVAFSVCPDRTASTSSTAFAIRKSVAPPSNFGSVRLALVTFPSACRSAAFTASCSPATFSFVSRSRGRARSISKASLSRLPVAATDSVAASITGVFMSASALPRTFAARFVRPAASPFASSAMSLRLTRFPTRSNEKPLLPCTARSILGAVPCTRPERSTVPG